MKHIHNIYDLYIEFDKRSYEKDLDYCKDCKYMRDLIGILIEIKEEIDKGDKD